MEAPAPCQGADLSPQAHSGENVLSPNNPLIGTSLDTRGLVVCFHRIVFSWVIVNFKGIMYMVIKASSFVH